MIVCLCEGVSARDIELAFREGAKSIEEISDRCGAGRGCGACHDQIREIIGGEKTMEDKEPCDISVEGEYKNV